MLITPGTSGRGERYLRTAKVAGGTGPVTPCNHPAWGAKSTPHRDVDDVGTSLFFVRPRSFAKKLQLYDFAQDY
jgi:hypothetical protein